MNFIPSIQFWLMCTIMVRLLGEKQFCSFESVFELNRGLRDFQTSINNKDLGLLVRKAAENICKDNIWSSFLGALALSSVICRPNHLFYALLGFKNIRKSLIKKFIQGKDVTITDVLSCYGHISNIKKQIIFHWITTLCLCHLTNRQNYWCLQNENMDIVIEKKLEMEACVKSAKESG